MNYIKHTGLAFLLIAGSLWTVQAQDVITLSNDRPAGGERISFTLQPADPAPSYEAQIFVFHPAGYNADDVTLDGLTGSYLLPDSATAFLVNYTVSGTETKSGLASAVYQDGKPVAGANYAYSLVYDGFGEYFSNIEADKEKSISYLEKEFEAYPQSADKWLATYIGKLPDGDKKDNIRHMVNARTKATFANPASTERQLREAYGLWAALSEQDSVALLTQETIARFPGGITETVGLFNEFRGESDYAKKTVLYRKLVAIKDDLPASTLQYMHSEMAKAAANEGDSKNLDAYIASIANPSSRASTLNSIAWPLAEKGENLELAGRLSKQSVDIVEELLEDPQKSKPANVMISQWKHQLENYSRPTFMDTYALIRYKQGALPEALQYQRLAVGEYNDADVNARFVQYLSESGLNEEALKAGEQAVRKGKATPETQAQLREIYLASGKTEQEFDAYHAGLESAYLQGLRDQLIGQLLDEEAPQFELKDLDGTSVTSQSMLGKVYVVDFWATWCGPCLASFPAMQTAVNKYADRDDIAFLFVNTWENIPNRETAVAKFIADNEYTFHVLFDTVDEARQFDVVSAYKVSGIPTKFVVDKEGKIRFKAVGYSGSSAEEVQKLSMMIELASNPEAAKGGE